MSSDIKLGDLVMVVKPKPCCGEASSMGILFITDDPRLEVSHVKCHNCGFVDFDLSNYFLFNGRGCAHVSRLKKIDPPALDEDIERVRELESE